MQRNCCLFSISSIPCLKEEKLTEQQNPWGSNTLEWTTPINPGHGNWTGEIPEVHRWAYDYGKDGRDFIPQTEPIGADESKHIEGNKRIYFNIIFLNQ